jgi:hypothetical protein
MSSSVKIENNTTTKLSYEENSTLTNMLCDTKKKPRKFVKLDIDNIIISQNTNFSKQVDSNLSCSNVTKSITYISVLKRDSLVQQFTYQSQKQSQKLQRIQSPEISSIKKHDAMLEAQDKFIDNFLAVIDRKTREDINNKLKSVNNYKKTLSVSCNNDTITILKQDTRFNFSRKQFFSRNGQPNKTFQYNLREKIKVLIPNAWITFKESKDVNTYCMTFSQLKY